MAATNGFFGTLQGPFAANEELLILIQADCKDTIDYISKLGIHYTGNYNLDLNGIYENQLLVRINNIEFQIGKTRMLQLEDVQITSIQFVNNTDDCIYIDYQYYKLDENN